MHRPAIGIDFGTTNSVVAMLYPDGRSETLRHATDEVFRSVLCFWPGVGGRPTHAAGPAAIGAYLDDPLESRLVMSMKSYLAQRSFTETRILGRTRRLEELVALFLGEFLAPFRNDLDGARVVIGRPVRFVGEAAEDPGLGERRLRAAFALAGMKDVEVALEPAGAGHRFAAGLDRAETVLVADFGGGTSDFSVMRFDPGPPRRVTPLGHSGIGVAGDAFDYRIIDHVVSPELGKGSSYTVMDKHLPVPPSWFTGFARWHQLSLMRAPKTLRDIAEVARTAEHPERLMRLIRLIEDEAGYALYRAVSEAKTALSRAEETVLRFAHADFAVEARIDRAAFEGWIAPELGKIASALDAALADAGLPPEQVDRVFLTGGTSLVPAVRRLFEERFGLQRIVSGGEFVSVAEGLALIAGEAGQETT
ncbi:Hsp70 family protein [Sabulicella rubraurantiaca]|uniref:Hsp70 family protein n=1 Tax=Sabulicella rubraurantiaca TaxID=2811429 RepID=UPI001A961DC7|nr:Hsp70 family protein [Sabulicella rubraurantiaca]